MAKAVEVMPPALVAERITVNEHTLIRMKLAANERVFITRSTSNGEVEFVQTEWWADSAGVVLGKVWTAPPGNYSVVIIPDERTADPRFIIVTVGKKKPGPDPGPDPEPDPDVPPPIPNRYGIGKTAYQNAIAINIKADAKLLSEIYFAAASRLAAMPDDANKLIQQINETYAAAHKETNERLSQPDRWSGFRNALKTAIENAWKNGFTTKDDAVNILTELAQAMEIAGR